MKKLILLIVLAAAAYGGYKIWISDGEVLNDYIGEENVMKAKEHLSALTDKPATADTATIAANWFATGPAVYLSRAMPWATSAGKPWPPSPKTD